MKTIILVLLLPIVALGQNSQFTNNRLTEMNVLGPVKKITETYYIGPDQKTSRANFVTTYFDSFGFIYKIEKKFKDSSKNQIHKIFKDTVNLTSRIEIHFINRSSLNRTFNCEYKNGHLLKKTEVDEYGTYVYEYTYDSLGRQIIQTYHNTGSRITKVVSFYDELPLTEIRYWLDKDDNFERVSTNVWTDSTRVKYIFNQSYKGKETTGHVKFDKFGNRTERCFIKSNNESTDTTCTFIKYEYDSIGNWIQKEEYTGDVLNKTFRREYEYF